MKKVVIFGIGHNYSVVKEEIENEFDVVALVDNNFDSMEGILPVESITNIEFDYVIVTPYKHQDMVEQLTDLGVESERIIVLGEISNLLVKKSIMGVNCYGQHYEDLIIAAIFGMIGIDRPSYLDIGANLAFDGSNTALLYLNGSKGVCVDANRRVIDLLNLRRSKDVNVHTGIYTEDGELVFYKFGDTSGINTMSKEEADKWSADYEMIGTEVVKVTTLDNIINTYCGGVFPDFLDCDIEGLDYEVLSNYDLKTNGPKVVCVEVRSHDISKFDVMMSEKTYFKFGRIGENNIYIRNEYRKQILHY